MVQIAQNVKRRVLLYQCATLKKLYGDGRLLKNVKRRALLHQCATLNGLCEDSRLLKM
jgi:hypothetical protein